MATSGEHGEGGDARAAAVPERVRFDAVRIGAADADAAVRTYAMLLGSEPLRLVSGAWRFQLDRGAVEIEAGESGLRGLRFTSADGDLPADFHGIDVRATPVVAADFVSPVRTAASEPDGGAPVADTPTPASAARAIDHVVIASTELDRAVGLWRDRLGVRLALDREFPRRGLRMLFFRSGGVTLEFVGALGASDPTGRDRLDGVAYEVVDLPAYRDRLAAGGLDVSPVRDGNKRGTRVATVRSGTAGVPTLLIEHLDRAAWRDESPRAERGPASSAQER